LEVRRYGLRAIQKNYIVLEKKIINGKILCDKSAGVLERV
jgi:hypothetical protein